MELRREHLEQDWPPWGEFVTQVRSLLIEMAYQKGPDRLTGCMSYISRKIHCGYNMAAEIMDDLERQGFISACDDRGRRSLIQPKD